MDKSYFPVNYRQLPSNITLKPISEKSFNVSGFAIECIPINHPNNGLAYFSGQYAVNSRFIFRGGIGVGASTEF
jgi:hypothetical protein